MLIRPSLLPVLQHCFLSRSVGFKYRSSTTGRMSRHEAEGVDGFKSVLSNVPEDKLIVYFSAVKKDDGIPWCPDCAEADPVVLDSLESLDENLHFLLLRVDRPYWKEAADNIFKQKHNVTCLPTLMRWTQPERLGEDDCKSECAVRNFLIKQ